MTERAVERLLELPEVRAARTFAGFVSTRSEISTDKLLDELRQREVDVVLPRVSTGLIPPRLRFHRVSRRSELVFGIFGLLEPGPDCSELPAQEIDVFMVPGLVFVAARRPDEAIASVALVSGTAVATTTSWRLSYAPIRRPPRLDSSGMPSTSRWRKPVLLANGMCRSTPS